jgi:hypothetical protein
MRLQVRIYGIYEYLKLELKVKKNRDLNVFLKI